MSARGVKILEVQGRSSRNDDDWDLEMEFIRRKKGGRFRLPDQHNDRILLSFLS